MAKRTVTKPAYDRMLPDAGEASRVSSGMAPDQWNAAVRLQVAVRDGIDRPVDLVRALTIAREVVTLAIAHVDIVRFQKQFDDQRVAEQQARIDQARSIAATAGQRR